MGTGLIHYIKDYSNKKRIKYYKWLHFIYSARAEICDGRIMLPPPAYLNWSRHRVTLVNIHYP